MSIDNLIAELQRQREIVIEQGFDPSQVEVLIPSSPEIPVIWNEVSDAHFEKTDSGIYDIYLR